ncbi:MAG: S41 family peptidase [Spirochaetia bacterium]|nr:S41 family peptidase [Spirochaetia bacterium]
MMFSKRSHGDVHRHRISLILGCVLLSATLTVRPLHADTETSHKYQQVLQNLMFYMQNMHVEKLEEKALLVGAIRGMLAASGDPYTRFLDKDEMREFMSAEEGRRVGIGVEVSIQGGVPIVIAPIEGGPADNAGILAGDRILSIDGKSTENVPFSDLVKSISGDSGSIVSIEIQRDGFTQPIKFNITRGIFKIEYVKKTYLSEGKIGYLRLTNFFGEEAGTTEKFRGALVEFKEKKVSGIIIDLRNNTGGHLDLAGTLSGYFLKPGQVVVRARGRDPAGNREITADKDAGLVPESTPVVILVNKGSASASEIMAGALQDHGRARLIGTRSFGKASVQQIVRPLPDDTGALITVQKYYTPKNRSIHGIGLEPDVAVDDIKPTPEETVALQKLFDTNIVTSFRKDHPKFTADLPQLFRTEAAKKGMTFSLALSKLILRREYPSAFSDYDLELDPQLARALKELGG